MWPKPPTQQPSSPELSGGRIQEPDRKIGNSGCDGPVSKMLGAERSDPTSWPGRLSGTVTGVC